MPSEAKILSEAKNGQQTDARAVRPYKPSVPTNYYLFPTPCSLLLTPYSLLLIP